jgi:hypothetical protein
VATGDLIHRREKYAFHRAFDRTESERIFHRTVGDI